MLLKDAMLIYKDEKWAGISLYYVRDVNHSLETYGFRIIDPDSDTEARMVTDCRHKGLGAIQTAEYIANFRITTFKNLKRPLWL